MSVKKHIFSCQYFGSSIVYLQNNTKSLWLEAHENYQKRSLRNRCYLLGPNAEQILSVPLQKGKNNQTSIKDVKISYGSDWQKMHIETIKACYNRSPFLEYYIEDIKSILDQKPVFLWDLNIQTMEWLISALRIDLKLKFTESYSNTDLIDLRHSESDIFKQHEHLFADKLKYAQVFEDKYGFRFCRSVLDLLFCTGPEASLYLKNDLVKWKQILDSKA